MADEARWLSGRVALVTGAGKRVGAAITLELARHGANVIVHYNSSAEEAGRVVEQAQALGVNAWAVQTDLSNPAAAASLLARSAQVAGPVDILINNASIFPPGTLKDMTVEDVHANIDINALSPLMLSRAFFAAHARQGRPGCIVNLLDARIVDYDKEHAAYHLSKQMLFSLTRMMAMEFAPEVRVNGIAPGLILPPAGQDEAYLERLAHTNPLGRHGAASDVAEAVLFLVKSDFITGQVIFVDGGRHMKGSMYGL